MSGSKSDAFGETVSCLVTLHRREVSHLRGQVLQLRASLAKLQAAALEAVAANRCADVDVVIKEVAAEMATLDLGLGLKDDMDGFCSETLDGAEQGLPTNLITLSIASTPREQTGPWPKSTEPSCTSRLKTSVTSGGRSRSAATTLEMQRTAILAEAAKYELPAAKRMKAVLGRVAKRQRSDERSLRACVNHPMFDTLCALMILFNAVLIGYTVERQTQDLEDEWSFIAGHFCNSFFLVELLLRMYAQGREYLSRDNRNWNLFDMVLVLASIIDTLLNDVFVDRNATRGFKQSTGSILKIFKMIRIIRVFRVFRFFRELALLAMLIVDSMCSLMWALLLLTIIIYVFAIWFTLQATEYLKTHADSDFPVLPEVYKLFGSLPLTVYSLVQAMLGGVSWGVVSDTLFAFDALSGGAFLFYISFCVLAVLNIITGVFVDNAFETARMQREFLIQKEMELRERYVGSMRILFSQMDVDGSGSITLDEVKQYFEDPRVHSYFQALGLDPGDLERLFALLDDDRSGELNLDEFLDGCLRLKGPARSIDVHALIMQCKKLEMDSEERFKRIEQLYRGQGCTKDSEQCFRNHTSTVSCFEGCDSEVDSMSI